MASRVTVHLIRHEKTHANLERKYIGWTDEPIVKPVQAELPVQPSEVHGSDLMRCRQTSACYFPQANYIEHKQLRELNFGDFEMCTYEQLQHNELYRAWIDEPLNVTPPNGEAFNEFERRVNDAFQSIVTQEQDYTFVVHGGVIRVLLALYGIESLSFQQTLANHRTLYTLTWDSMEQFLGGARCTSFSEAPITVNERM